MRFASLGSGSRGNAWVIEAGDTRILVDCGFGPRELERRLARVGLSGTDISAVWVTHEHTDHVGGVWSCARRFGFRVLLTHGTLAACGTNASGIDVVAIDSHARVEFRSMEVQPFPVPHDAREPVQFVVSDGSARLGMLTDIGETTRHVERLLAGCDALVLECNHDEHILANGTYPEPLKRRIAGRQGHLSNASASTFLSRIRGPRLRQVVAAHLSERNNRPDLARQAIADAMDCDPNGVCVATQDEGCGWQRVT